MRAAGKEKVKRLSFTYSQTLSETYWNIVAKYIFKLQEDKDIEKKMEFNGRKEN